MCVCLGGGGGGVIGWVGGGEWFVYFVFIDLHEKYEYVMISVRLSECPFVAETLNDAIFSDTLNMINVKLCMMVVLIEHYPFIPLSLTLTAYQGHSSVCSSC